MYIPEGKKGSESIRGLPNCGAGSGMAATATTATMSMVKNFMMNAVKYRLSRNE
jgi:hypothetical protein